MAGARLGMNHAHPDRADAGRVIGFGYSWLLRDAATSLYLESASVRGLSRPRGESPPGMCLMALSAARDRSPCTGDGGP